MGYYSDVAYIIAGEDADIAALIVEAKITLPRAAEALAECTIGRHKDGVVYIGFHAPNVKWYDSYPDVQQHESLWSLAVQRSEAEESTLEGRKVIVGESDDDATTDQFGEGDYGLYEAVGLSRSVDVNMGLAKEDDIRETLCAPA